MAPLSPEKCGSGKKSLIFVLSLEFCCSMNFVKSWRRRWLAETPPAMMRVLVSGFCFRASLIFSIRISVAVCSKEAAKSAFCCGLRSSANFDEGKEIG